MVSLVFHSSLSDSTSTLHDKLLYFFYRLCKEVIEYNDVAASFKVVLLAQNSLTKRF